MAMGLYTAKTARKDSGEDDSVGDELRKL